MIRFWPLLTGLFFLIFSPPLSSQEQLTRAHMEEDVRELVEVVGRPYAYVEEKKTDAGVESKRRHSKAKSACHGGKGFCFHLHHLLVGEPPLSYIQEHQSVPSEIRQS